MLKHARRKVEAVAEEVRNWPADCCEELEELEDVCRQESWWRNGLDRSQCNSVYCDSVGTYDEFVRELQDLEDSVSAKAQRAEDICRKKKSKLHSSRREHNSRLRRLAKVDRKGLLLSVSPSRLQAANDRSSVERHIHSTKALGKHGGRHKRCEAHFDAEDLPSSSDDDVVCQHPCQSITSMAHGQRADQGRCLESRRCPGLVSRKCKARREASYSKGALLHSTVNALSHAQAASPHDINTENANTSSDQLARRCGEAKEMKKGPVLQVVTMSGHIYSRTAPVENLKVIDIKEALARHLNMPAARQALLYKDTLLDDSRRLDAYVPSGCFTQPMSHRSHGHLIARTSKRASREALRMSILARSYAEACRGL